MMQPGFGGVGDSNADLRRQVERIWSLLSSARDANGDLIAGGAGGGSGGGGVTPLPEHEHNGTSQGGVLIKPLLVEGPAPATPPAGHVVYYAKADGLIYQKDDAGTETVLAGAGGGGDVATDVIWNAVGDAVRGTGVDTAERLAITVPAANIVNVLGVVNGETTFSWKSLMDATVATTQAFGDAAAAGTGVLVARITHKHAMPAVPSIDTLTDVDTATTPPSLSNVLTWNGTNWVPTVSGYSFTFTLDSFTATDFTGTALIGAGTWKAIAAVTFTAAYTNMPGGTTAAVALTGSAADWSGLALAGATGPTTNATAITYPTTRTGTLTVTVTPTNSPTPTTRTDTESFSNTMRYGTNANGIGAQTEANLEALTEVAGPNESRDQTISNIPTGTVGHFLTFGHGASLSNVAQVQMDEGFGFATASFHSTATTLAPAVQTPVTNVANSAGFSESFDAVTSRLADLPNGTRDFKLLTTSTAINNFYWGELNVASTADGAAVYTEANVEGNYATQPGKVASNTLARSCIVNAAAGEYAYIAYPSRLGLLTSIVIGGFESIGDFWKDHTAGSELAITNAGGYTENYYVYVSKNPSFTNPTTMVIS